MGELPPGLPGARRRTELASPSKQYMCTSGNSTVVAVLPHRSVPPLVPELISLMNVRTRKGCSTALQQGGEQWEFSGLAGRKRSKT